MEKFFMTQEGFDELQKKLNYLKTVRRLEASERIKQAREYGDLSENAEYDAAKDEQAMIEADIRKIEAQLENAEIIADGGGSKNVVVMGSKVTLLDVDMNEEEEWLIVGTTEASFRDGKLSNESPLAQAILGKRKGDVVTVRTPQATYDVKIVKIEK